MKTPKSSNPRLDQDLVIDGTLKTLSDLSRLTAFNGVYQLNGKKCRLDQIISASTGQARETLINSILEYLNRHELAIASDESVGFDFDEEDLHGIDYDGLLAFVSGYHDGAPQIGLRKLENFRTFVALRVEKILNHQDFQEARECLNKQSNPKTGVLYSNGLISAMSKFGYLKPNLKADSRLYHGVRHVGEIEEDLSPDDEIADLMPVNEYANYIQDKITAGILPRATAYNLPTLEGVQVTPRIDQTQGLAVIRFPVENNLVWQHPADIDASDLQIFKPKLVPAKFEVLIKDSSFMSQTFLRGEGLKDIMALAAKQITAFQDYLSKLAARLDYLGVPYKYVDINGLTHQLSVMPAVESSRKSGDFDLDGLAKTDKTSDSKVIAVNFRDKVRA